MAREKAAEDYQSSKAIRRRPARLAKSLGLKAQKPNSVGRPKAGAMALEAEAAILRASLHLFSQMGFAAVSTKDISAASGLNTALIYYYFNNKEDLFRRCVVVAAEEAADAFRGLSRRATGAEQQVLAWIDCHERQYSKMKRLLQISMSYSTSTAQAPAVDKAIDAFYNEATTFLTEALQSGIERREIPRLDITQTVLFITRFLDGVHLRGVLFPKHDVRGEVETLRQFVRARLNATEA